MTARKLARRTAVRENGFSVYDADPKLAKVLR